MFVSSSRRPHLAQFDTSAIDLCCEKDIRTKYGADFVSNALAACFFPFPFSKKKNRSLPVSSCLPASTAPRYSREVAPPPDGSVSHPKKKTKNLKPAGNEHSSCIVVSIKASRSELHHTHRWSLSPSAPDTPRAVLPARQCRCAAAREREREAPKIGGAKKAGSCQN